MADKKPVILDGKLASLLADKIRDLTSKYSYNPNGSDYQCVFCYAYDGNCEKDCESHEYLKALEPTEEG